MMRRVEAWWVSFLWNMLINWIFHTCSLTINQFFILVLCCMQSLNASSRALLMQKLDRSGTTTRYIFLMLIALFLDMTRSTYLD
jgi:hypothetical protein